MSILKTPIQIETKDATENPAAANPNPDRDAIQLPHRFTGSGLAASR
jgi:hypothetical protein